MNKDELQLSAYERAAARREKARRINLIGFKWSAIFFITTGTPFLMDAAMVQIRDEWNSVFGIRALDAPLLAAITGGLVGSSILVLAVLRLASRKQGERSPRIEKP